MALVAPSCTRKVPQFPPEILAEITKCVDKGALLSLCRVSRTFNVFCNRSIYNSILLKDFEKIENCLQTLAHNKSAADEVKTLSLDFTCPISEHISPDFLCLYETAMKKIGNNLTCFTLISVHTEFLDHFHFRHLQRFSTTLPVSLEVAQFIERHSEHLTALILLGHQSDVSLSERVVLPRLQYFTGRPETCDIFVRGSQLSDACVIWDPLNPDRDPGEIIEVLSQSTKPIRRLTCQGFHFDDRLFISIASHLTQIEQLFFGDRRHVSTPEFEDFFYAGINYMLPTLKCLRLLEISWSIRDSPTTSTIDEESHMISNWSAVCPSLSVCRMPTQIAWMKLAGSWIPSGSDVAAYVAWWWNKKLANKNEATSKLFHDIAASLIEGRSEVSEVAMLPIVTDEQMEV